MDGAIPQVLLAPIGSQEVWAAGVTYYRSRDARMDEARESGGSTFYDRVYEAPRPELFFKATAPARRGPGRRRPRAQGLDVDGPRAGTGARDRRGGAIVGYTVGNDMSARDIEGENPLYLPQAKVYDGSCAIGPAVLFTADPLPATTAIRLRIARGGVVAFEGRRRPAR